MPKRAVFERSRRGLSVGVSVGVHVLLVVEQSSLESQSRGCGQDSDTYGSSSEGCCLFRCRHGPINVRLSFSHTHYWYVVDMLMLMCDAGSTGDGIYRRKKDRVSEWAIISKYVQVDRRWTNRRIRLLNFDCGLHLLPFLHATAYSMDYAHKNINS